MIGCEQAAILGLPQAGGVAELLLSPLDLVSTTYWGDFRVGTRTAIADPDGGNNAALLDMVQVDWYFAQGLTLFPADIDSPIPVELGKTYRLSTYVRAVTLNVPLRFGLTIPASSINITYVDNVILTTSWQFITFDWVSDRTDNVAFTYQTYVTSSADLKVYKPSMIEVV